MAGNAQQKRKLLVLKEILERCSDEEHPMTASELGEELSKAGISANRKSIYHRSIRCRHECQLLPLFSPP